MCAKSKGKATPTYNTTQICNCLTESCNDVASVLYVPSLEKKTPQ